jgi:hypothetical protein
MTSGGDGDYSHKGHPKGDPVRAALSEEYSTARGARLKIELDNGKELDIDRARVVVENRHHHQQLIITNEGEDIIVRNQKHRTRAEVRAAQTASTQEFSPNERPIGIGQHSYVPPGEQPSNYYANPNPIGSFVGRLVGALGGILGNAYLNYARFGYGYGWNNGGAWNPGLGYGLGNSLSSLLSNSYNPGAYNPAYATWNNYNPNASLGYNQYQQYPYQQYGYGGYHPWFHRNPNAYNNAYNNVYNYGTPVYGS